MFDINFDDSSVQIISHPDYHPLIPTLLEALKPYDLKDHFILFSSGTTSGALKGYALSKKALLKNAEAVNTFFHLNSNDTWGLSLPLYHVGGLSVLMRAHLLKNKIIDARKWDPHTWRKTIEEVTVTSIVPTQLYDLVKHNILPPPTLRYLMVGGDFLSQALKLKALKLGWPVIRTFGMSEVSSQLASSHSPLSDDLEILPIHDVKIQEGRILVKSPSLFTLEFVMGKTLTVNHASELSTPEDYYLTKDHGEIKGNILIPLGRSNEEIKISGHLVDIHELKEKLYALLLQKELYGEMDFLVERDERLGSKLILILSTKAHDEAIIQEVSELIRPGKISEVRVVDHLQRTFLGKLKKQH